MANIEEISEESRKKIIELIRLLIRYDIPVLLLGKSSIGKSFTIISLAKRWKMPNQILYVGSEKSEHIEGLPKLTTAESTALEYFQPYWFPDEKTISQIVTQGRNRFNDFRDNSFVGDFSYTYRVLSKLLELLGQESFSPGESEKQITLIDRIVPMNEKPITYSKTFKVERQIVESGHEGYYRDDLRDICVYLTTLLGYGNFWLILDEIDKVEEGDIDKYAPMLHIVRERWLKKWKLQPINEGRGIGVGKMVQNGNYTPIKDAIDRDIKNNQPLLDTRIIAIANKTTNIEEALFRRFLQVIIEELLILDKLEKDAEEIKSCIDEKLGQEELQESFKEGLSVKRISDVNLQWSANFFVKLLNKTDAEGNFIRENYIDEMAGNVFDKEREPEKWEAQKNELAKLTMLHKVLRDNFEGQDLVNELFDCLSNRIDVKETIGKTPIEQAKLHIAQMSDDGYDINEMKDEIIETLTNSYPATAKDKLGELTRWADMCLAYISATMFDKGRYAQTELNKILIPHVQKLIYKQLSSDSSLNIDNINAILSNVSKYWENIISGPQGSQGHGPNAIPLNKIKVTGEEVQKVLYGGTIDEIKSLKDSEKVKQSVDTVFGAGKFARTETESTNAYKESLSYKIAMKQAQDLLIVLHTYAKNYGKAGASVRITNLLKEHKEYPSLLKFIKENHLSQIKNYIAGLKASGKAEAVDIANEIEKLIS